jgi:hypothetical protein
MKRVAGLHLIANAALIALVYLWLGIRDAQASQIAVTVLLGAALIAGALFLHAGTRHWMRTNNWRVSQKELLGFALGITTLLICWWLLSLIPQDRAAQWTASFLTLHTRTPIRPERVASIFNALVWALKWFVIPILILREHRHPRFWLMLATALLLGVYIPQRLVHWTPNFKSTTAEILSMTLRWSVAYALATACWLTVLRFTALSATPQASPPPESTPPLATDTT